MCWGGDQNILVCVLCLCSSKTCSAPPAPAVHARVHAPSRESVRISHGHAVKQYTQIHTQAKPPVCTHSDAGRGAAPPSEGGGRAYCSSIQIEQWDQPPRNARYRNAGGRAVQEEDHAELRMGIEEFICRHV